MNKKASQRNQILIDLIHQKKWPYLGAIISVGIASYFMFLVPTIGKLVIDRVITEPRVHNGDKIDAVISWVGGPDALANQLWLAGLAIVIVTALSGLFMYLKDYLAAGACETTVRELRNKLYHHLHHIDERYLNNADSGDILQRCTSDIDTLREFLTMQVMNIGRTIILMAVVIPLMFMQNAWLTVLSLILVPVVLYYGMVFFVKVRELFQKVDEAEGELTTIVQENLTGIRVVRAFARQDYECEKFDEKNARYSDLNYKLICMFANFWSLSDLLCIAQSGIVLIGGGWLTAQGHISFGTYFAFIGYTNLLIWPIRQLGKELSEAGKATVAIGRIQEILEAPEEEELQNVTPLPDRIMGAIKFENIHFQYDKDRPVLTDVSFDVAPGETIAIVGPTGAGKSTLIQLLMRLHDYEQGSISVDGIELSSIARKDIRHQIGTLLQEPFLFSRSLRENIKFSHLEASDGAMVHSTTAAAVHHTIESFQGGYSTVIGERGVSLSGGQKQRVTLSRTLLNTPPILVLDDTLSAVDASTEQKIISALHEKKGEQTLLIITHRISVCQKADRIIVMQDGRITDQGTHNELTHRDGFYNELWEIQSDQKDQFESEIKVTV
ncbi:ABC transporter ATP-binding protein [Reinekea marina]|uniref:ABC transporter ATP-binding protein n=1 Tax=Reinekea marina TaxID=1310421 RepID=A0ABV7WXX3_9GAMM|nr:ABC transporter ATP-binding protein [Reinekea marina]MDN3647545.1 ABC transporter ATP-binding protein [Reinekea marina]MDN3651114.1 ABC transporter ATP-binding protein [Reinekea marina]